MGKLSQLKGRLSRSLSHYKGRFFRTSYPVILPAFGNTKKTRGRVLFSYLENSLLWPEHSSRFLGHSNFWESRMIAQIFQCLGYTVEAINWTDREFVPTKHYEIVFDIFENLGRWTSHLDSDTIKLLHCTGSDPYYQNKAELQRVIEVNQRRNGNYKPKRMIAKPELTYRSLEIADACSLIGNEHTRSTYPEKFWPKIKLVTVSGSSIGQSAKGINNYVPPEREFLWFFGSGAVHKGLDLVLEVFSRQHKLKLNIVGSVEGETDFMEIYDKELTQLDNIKYYGPLNPSSSELQKIISRVFCFIAPTCSESISTAAATCLQLGLYPIISRDTGITLPDNCGIYLDTCTIDEIEKYVVSAYEMSQETIVTQIQQTQKDAFQRYSREAFRKCMTQYITEVIFR